MPPMPVEIVTLAAKPLEQTSEFVASLKSRRSSTIQPEVEGFLTRIAVQSGQNVRQGDVLFEIDSATEQAALASLQSMRPMRESEVEFARQQVQRNKTLLNAGAISQREVEQFESQLRSAEAQLKTLDEQIRQQRSQLNYHRVVAPNSGTVGDIAVNTGGRVTRATVLTTVDDRTHFFFGDGEQLFTAVDRLHFLLARSHHLLNQLPGLLPIRILHPVHHIPNIMLLPARPQVRWPSAHAADTNPALLPGCIFASDRKTGVA